MALSISLVFNIHCPQRVRYNRAILQCWSWLTESQRYY
jgi:hypothetical protein